MAGFNNSDPSIITYRKGLVSGEALGAFSGFTSNVNTSFSTVWGEDSIYVYPLAGIQMSISSSSNNDTIAGTGCRQVLIAGLDSNRNPLSEIIAMNGQTPVLTVSSDWFRINICIIVDAGSNRINQGIVYVGVGTVTAGEPVTKYSHMPIETGSTLNGTYSLPANISLSPTHVIISGDSSKPVEIKIIVQNAFGNGEEIVTFSGKGFKELTDVHIPFGPGLGGASFDIRWDVKIASGSGGSFSFTYYYLRFPTTPVL